MVEVEEFEELKGLKGLKELKGFLAGTQNKILLLPEKSGLTKRKLKIDSLISFAKRSRILSIHPWFGSAKVLKKYNKKIRFTLLLSSGLSNQKSDDQ